MSRVLAEKATGGRKITDRMYTEQQARQAKQQELKRAMDEKALAEMRAAPEINEVHSPQTPIPRPHSLFGCITIQSHASLPPIVCRMQLWCEKVALREAAVVFLQQVTAHDVRQGK